MTWQPNRLEQERLSKAEALEARGIATFQPRVQRTHTAAQALALGEANSDRLEDAAEGDAADLTVTVAGRIRRVNIKGKVSFVHIEDGTGRIQLFLRVNEMDAAEYALIAEKYVEMDDFVQATGVMMRTQAGEISVRVRHLRLLAKALSPLPVIKEEKQDDGTIIEHGEFTDVETRYRQRYADLAVNRRVREVFVARASVMRTLREFLDGEGMLEVETPILQPLYGGAAARPFTTHHNELEQDMYLRVSFELYLKRLLVGMYDGVYEIGRDFRNEGVSWKHNPEFTMLEFYKAYIDYHGVMDINERMVAACAQAVHGSTRAVFDGHEIEYAPPWRRVTMREAIREKTDIDYVQFPTADLLEAEIVRRFNPNPADFKRSQPWGKGVEWLFGEFVEKTLIQPTFVLDYPRDISPFAKQVEGDPLHVERFEAYIGGMEISNAFTELNDPRVQEQRFLDMAATFREGEDDETPLDEDYLRAMRYGMPPNGGFGMGIDRLLILLLDQKSIRDVLLYPALKSRDQGSGVGG